MLECIHETTLSKKFWKIVIYNFERRDKPQGPMV
jgi:hypothetical protein